MAFCRVLPAGPGGGAAIGARCGPGLVSRLRATRLSRGRSGANGHARGLPCCVSCSLGVLGAPPFLSPWRLGAPLVRVPFAPLKGSIVNKFVRFSGAAALVSLGGQVFAAVPAEVTTAVGDMKTDGLAVATAVLVAVIAIAAIKFIRKGL